MAAVIENVAGAKLILLVFSAFFSTVKNVREEDFQKISRLLITWKIARKIAYFGHIMIFFMLWKKEIQKKSWHEKKQIFFMFRKEAK